MCPPFLVGGHLRAASPTLSSKKYGRLDRGASAPVERGEHVAAPRLGDSPHLRVAHDEEVTPRDAGDGDPPDLVRVHPGLHERRELRRRLLRPAEPRLPGPARVPDLRPDDARAEDADPDP